MTEEDHIQASCVTWFNIQYRKLEGLLFHVANGGKRQSKINKYGKRYSPEAKKLKLMGVVPGVSDLILLYPNNEWAGLVIEMKTPEGVQSTSQKKWQKLIERDGFYKYVICRSVYEFQNIINDYLKHKP